MNYSVAVSGFRRSQCYHECYMRGLSVSNVPLNDVIRPITFVITELEVARFRTCDLSIPGRPDGVLQFPRAGDGVGCNRRQDTPTTVFRFAIVIIKFRYLYVLSIAKLLYTF